MRDFACDGKDKLQIGLDVLVLVAAGFCGGKINEPSVSVVASISHASEVDGQFWSARFKMTFVPGVRSLGDQTLKIFPNVKSSAEG